MVDVILGINKKLPREEPCIGNSIEYGFIKRSVLNLVPGKILLVYGPPGCGKTFLIKNAVNALKKNMIVVNPAKIKLNQINLSVISALTKNLILIDDLDQMQDMDSSMINKILENKKVPILCTCRNIPKKLAKKKEGVIKILLKYIPKNEIKKWLTKNKYPVGLADYYEGDLNAFMTRLDLWKVTGWMGNRHEKYINIEERLQSINTIDLAEAFNCHIEEPGAMCGLIQQNVPNFKNMDMETNADICDNLSMADVYSTPLYNGLFGASPVYQDYFYTSSIVQLRDKIPPKKIEPGQAWTRHINMVARSNKLRKFKSKNKYPMTPDHINVFNHFLSTIKKINVEQLENYIIENEDVDCFTKLFTVSKITPRVKAHLKETLSQMREG